MKNDAGKLKAGQANLGWNDILAFVLEMGALALWGLWAWSLPKVLLWKMVLTAACIGGFVTLWALFFARNAANRPGPAGLLIGKLLLLLPPGLLYFRQKPLYQLVWSGLILLHLVLGAIFHKL